MDDMVETYDVGSMPFDGDFKKFSEGATQLVSHSINENLSDSVKYFERMIVERFLDKLEAEIDTPNYPQFRDMSKMFLSMIDGIEKLDGGYVEIEKPSLKGGKPEIPEVSAIRMNSREIYERNNCSFKIKVCITGPYTLASLFAYRDPQIYSRLGGVLSKIVEGNIFDNKYGRVEMVAIDEPLFGLVDDSTIDVGSEGRETLLRAWEKIFHEALRRDVQTCIHLHSTTDELFWDVESLRVIETHVDDPLYSSRRTKELIESRDKLLKASVCISNFDELIKRKLFSNSKREDVEVTQRIGDVWKKINSGKADPNMFLEDINTMRRRLTEAINRFGSERVVYAGPECGLRSFPTYECAVECLKRVSKTAKHTK